MFATRSSPRVHDDAFDLVAIGETMAMLISRDDPERYVATAGGAESNLAVGMARLGLRTRWVSRLGDDPFGELVADAVAEGGVEVAAVRDTVRPTGLMIKHLTGSKALVQYYRSESAARHLGVDDLERVGATRWVHVTGITPALSDSARDLVAAVVDGAIPGAGISFDVNLRTALWPDTATAAEVITPLASKADVVFIGDDEAEALFGTTEPDALARLLRGDGELVIKRGAGPATVMSGDDMTTEPSLAVPVVDVTGAGDAFAAGYLAARRFGWTVQSRLRLGHLMASRVIGMPGDLSPPLPADELDDLSPDWLDRRWGTAAPG